MCTATRSPSAITCLTANAGSVFCVLMSLLAAIIASVRFSTLPEMKGLCVLQSGAKKRNPSLYFPALTNLKYSKAMFLCSISFCLNKSDFVWLLSLNQPPKNEHYRWGYVGLINFASGRNLRVNLNLELDRF